jgi:hypothetical protein
MSTIIPVQNHQATGATNAQDTQRSDQSTRDKVRFVAMTAIKTIAVIATVVAAVALGSTHTILPLLKEAAPFVLGFAALAFLATTSKDTDHSPVEMVKRNQEWKKDAADDRESDAQEKVSNQKREDLKETSSAWHGGNNSDFVAVGTRKV